MPGALKRYHAECERYQLFTTNDMVLSVLQNVVEILIYSRLTASELKL